MMYTRGSQVLSDVVVILLHYGDVSVSWESLRRLRTFYPNPDNPRVIVVENGMSAGAFPPSWGIEVVTLPSNRGYGAGMNAGLRAARARGGEFFILLNNDVVLSQGSLELMRRTVTDKRAGLVGAVVQEPEGIVFGGGSVSWWRLRAELKRSPVPDHHLSYIHGACLGITRETLERVGFFKENLFMYWEDVEYGLRARRASIRLATAHTEPLEHLRRSQPDSDDKTYFLVRNAVRVACTAGSPLLAWYALCTSVVRRAFASARGRAVVARAMDDALRGMGGDAPPDLTLSRYSNASAEIPEGPRPELPRSVSVIIVTHEAASEIAACLQVLPAACASRESECIVVDTQSSDRTVHAVLDSGLPTLARVVPNGGFAAAANEGARQARGDVLFFLNPDARLSPGTLEKLLEVFKDPRVAAVSGILRDESGRRETAGEPFPSLWWYIIRRIPFLRRGFLAVPLVQSSTCAVPFLSGAALCVRADVFRSVGGFDERYFLYYEDIDLCRRLRAQGYDIQLDPRVSILHRGGRSASRAERLKHSDAAEDRYFALHRPWWERRTLQVLRPFFRLFSGARLPSLLAGLGAFAAVSAGLLSGQSNTLVLASVAGALGILTLSARLPAVGAAFLFTSVVVGQMARLTLGPLGGMTITDALLPLVLVGWVIHTARVRVMAQAYLWLTSFGLLAAALLPGLLLAGERLPTGDWVTAASYAARLFLIVALLPLGTTVRVSPRMLTQGFLLTAVALAFIGLVQIWVVPTLAVAPGAASCALPNVPCALQGWDPHIDRLFATWLDPNLLGGLLVLSLALLWAAPPARSAFRTFGIVGGALVISAALVLTKSRSALLSLLPVVILGTVMLRAWRKLPALFAGLLIGALLVPSLVLRIANLGTGDPTALLRLASWRRAAEIAARFPAFGVGYNAYPFEQLADGYIPSLALHARAGADSSWLTFLATTGFFGAGFILGAFLLLTWALLRRWRVTGSWPAAASVIALAALAVHSQFTHSAVYIHLAVPFFLLLAAAFSPRSPISKTVATP